MTRGPVRSGGTGGPREPARGPAVGGPVDDTGHRVDAGDDIRVTARQRQFSGRRHGRGQPGGRRSVTRFVNRTRVIRTCTGPASTGPAWAGPAGVGPGHAARVFRSGRRANSVTASISRLVRRYRGNSPGGSSSGSPDGTLSAGSSCTQVTVEVLESFSCSVTASGGTPGYGWTLFINGQLIAENGTMPPGFETTTGYENGQDVTETLAGKPELTGTYHVTFTATDMTPVNPPHTASASFTVVVTPNPDVKTLQP